MSLQRGLDGPDPGGSDGVNRPAGLFELRKSAATGRLATGTLACPHCDAPTEPPAAALAPADPYACGFCGHAAHVRDFLSLAAPTRPTRVEVRIVAPGRVRVRAR